MRKRPKRAHTVLGPPSPSLQGLCQSDVNSVWWGPSLGSNSPRDGTATANNPANDLAHPGDLRSPTGRKSFSWESMPLREGDRGGCVHHASSNSMPFVPSLIASSTTSCRMVFGNKREGVVAKASRDRLDKVPDAKLRLGGRVNELKGLGSFGG